MTVGMRGAGLDRTEGTAWPMRRSWCCVVAMFALLALALSASSASAAAGPTDPSTATGPATAPHALDPAAQIGKRRSRKYVSERLNPAAVDYYIKTFGVTESAEPVKSVETAGWVV